MRKYKICVCFISLHAQYKDDEKTVNHNCEQSEKGKCCNIVKSFSCGKGIQETKKLCIANCYASENFIYVSWKLKLY